MNQNQKKSTHHFTNPYQNLHDSDNEFALICLLERHTRSFKATHSWIKCQRFLDESSHSMCLEKKEEILTYLPVVWIGTELGDDVAREVQPFHLCKHLDATTHRTLFYVSNKARNNLFFTSLCSIWSTDYS